MPATAPAAPAAPAVPAAVTNGASKGAPQQPANPAPSTAPGAPAQASSADEPVFEVKVAGELKKFTRAEAERLLSKAGFADQVIRQGKEALKRTQELEAKRAEEEAKRKEYAKTNKRAFLKEHGFDEVAFAKEILEEQVRLGQMTPEQKRAAELEEENKRLKAEGEARTKQEASAREQQAQQHLQQRIENDLANAAKRAGIEPSGDSFYAIYEAFQEAVKLDLPWDPDRIVEVAKENMDAGMKGLQASVLKGLKGDALLERLGEPVWKAVIEARKEQIERMRGAQIGGNRAAPTNTAPAPAAARPSKYLTASEADEQLKRLGR